MKTVAETTSGIAGIVANATPATTLIAAVVEQQVAAGETPDLGTASATISKALNLPTGTDLTKVNPKTNKVAAKAAAFVANALDSMPSGVNKAAAYESIKNIAVKASETDTPLVTISDDAMTIGAGFSIADIARDMVSTNAGSVSNSDIEKLVKSEATINAQLRSASQAAKPFDTMTEAEQISAISADQTLEVLNNAIDKITDVSSMNVGDLNKLAVVTEQAITNIMESAALNGESAIGAVDASNVGTLAAVLQDNLSKFKVDADGDLDFTTSTISLDTLSNVAESAQTMAAEIALTSGSTENSEMSNHIMENMFSKLDLTDALSVGTLDNIQVSDIVEISNNMILKSAELITEGDTNAEDNFLESMADVIAS